MKTKRKTKTKALQLPAGDIGTPERHARNEVEVVDIALGAGKSTVKGARVIHECVLDTYEKRGQITERHHVTGIKVRGLWERATGGASLTAGYEEMIAGMSVMSEDAIDAREVLNKAIRRLDSDEGELVIRVCGCNEWAGEALMKIDGGAQRRTAPRALRDGLDKLADGWGIPRYGLEETA